MVGNAGNEAELVRLVRQRDYARFLAIQLAPTEKRPALYAVTALATEIAVIPHLVREPLLGFVRFAWWREALEEIAAGKPPRHHPVLLAMGESLPRYPAMLPHLLRLIAARQSELEEIEIENEEQWLAYLADLHESLHSCWLLILEVPVQPALRELSLAFGLWMMERAVAAQETMRFQSNTTPIKEEVHAEYKKTAPPILEEGGQQRLIEVLRRLNAYRESRWIAPKPIRALEKITEWETERMLRCRNNEQNLTNSGFSVGIIIRLMMLGLRK